jgi:signal transduction histidine kinase
MRTAERIRPSAQDNGQSFAPPPSRVPGFLSRYSSVLFLLLIVGLEAGVVQFVIRDLHSANTEVQRMYAGSVQGLRRIGGLQYDAQETRRATLYALTTNDSNLQVEYADQTRDADKRVTEGITQYLQQAELAREVEAGKRLHTDWTAYLSVRNEVLASILEGSTKEAVARDLSQGVPSFDRVRQDLEEIKRLYDARASEQLANVAVLANRSVTRLFGVLLCTLFLASVFVWVLQRNKMASTLQLARMQMDFVASVSHELRTPLAVLCSAADNLADGVVSGKEQLAKYSGVIRNQSRQINGLVNEVILFTSTQNGKGRYVLRPLQVSLLVQSAIDSTSELIQRAGFTLEKDIDLNIPSVMGDASALSQCLQNLITNALKYGARGRWISVQAHVGDSKDRKRQEIRISVHDRGMGIDRADLPHIFEPFYRSPAAVAGQIHGAGLGLPIAKSLAEAMGGSLSVRTELGIGSVFILHLPIPETNIESNQIEEERPA